MICMCCVHVISDVYDTHTCDPCVCVYAMPINPSSLSSLVAAGDAVFISSLLPALLGPVLHSLFTWGKQIP